MNNKRDSRGRKIGKWHRLQVSGLLAVILACSALIDASIASEAANSRVADFVDVAEKAGLKAVNVFGGKNMSTYILESTGTGVVIFDYDNDGWPDIFLVNGTTLEAAHRENGPTGHLYHNNHDGTFSDVTARAGLLASGWGQGACAGDYDNDGWEDLYVTYYGKNRLYRNRGDGTFEEVAERAGVAGSGEHWSTGCAFVDFDRDGRVDLLVARYAKFDLQHAAPPGSYPTCQWKGIAVFCGPRGLPSDTNVLYRNIGGRYFEDVTTASRIDRTSGHYCFSVSALDFDNDGWPDIYVACDSAPSILYHNMGDGTFVDVGALSGVAYNVDGREQAGMGIAVADYDGDGNLDLFRTNFSDDTPTLYRNEGDGSFGDVTYSSGLGSRTQYLGWGSVFFDFDNDGHPDLLLVNGHVYPEVDTLSLSIEYAEPKLLYRNNGNGTFMDVSDKAGIGISTKSPARGLAVGDLWNDGRLSAVIANRNGTPNLLVNRARYPNHWIGVKAEGTRSNRSGIGTRVRVRTESGDQTDEVRSGSSYLSQSDSRLHFGLGPNTKIDYVEAHWPSGLVERFASPVIDRILVMKEGLGEAVSQTPRQGTPKH